MEANNLKAGLISTQTYSLQPTEQKYTPRANAVLVDSGTLRKSGVTISLPRTATASPTTPPYAEPHLANADYKQLGSSCFDVQLRQTVNIRLSSI